MAAAAADSLSKLTINDLASASPNLHKNLSLLSPQQVYNLSVFGWSFRWTLFIDAVSCVYYVGGVGEGAVGFESGSFV